MAEKSRRGFVKLPIFIARPKSAKLAASEAGPHAYRRIVPGYGTAARQPHQTATEERPFRAAWFYGNENASDTGASTQQFAQLLRCKVMQEQVRDQSVVIVLGGLAKPVKNIRYHNLWPPTKPTKRGQGLRFYNTLPVNHHHAEAGPSRTEASAQAPQEIPVSGAEFDDARRCLVPKS